MCDIGHSTCEQVNIHHRQGKGANPLLVACNDNQAPDLTTTVMQKQTFTTALVTQLPALRRYAIGLVGKSALADDLVQDCFERALGRAAQLREPERLGGWLRRILYNLYIDEVRRRKTRGREEDVAELADQLELSTPAPDNSGEREFMHAVSRLSAEHRQILLLVSVEELSYREIAVELDLPIGTVMSRLARARERLRSLLEEDAANFKANLTRNNLAGKMSRE